MPFLQHRGGVGIGTTAAWHTILHLAALSAPAHSALITGTLETVKDTTGFVGEFCMDYDHQREVVGHVFIEVQRPSLVKMPPAPKQLYFVLFSDEKAKWQSVLKIWDHSDCEEKLNRSSFKREIAFIGNQKNTSYTIHITEITRPRWWYFTFVTCNPSFDLPLSYRIHSVNYRLHWEKELSFDHAGLPKVYAFFTAGFLGTTLATAWATRWRGGVRDTNLPQHPYFQLLLLTQAASTLSCFLFLVHNAMFIFDGLGSKRLRFMGVIATAVADCTIFLLAMLVGSGWAISRFDLPSRRTLLGAVAAIGGINAFCELGAEDTSVYQSSRLYSYQSVPGILSLVLKIIIFCWFIFRIKGTYVQEMDSNRRWFYNVFTLSVTGWALNMPLTVSFAFFFDPWVRYKVVIMTDIIVRFMGQAAISALFCGAFGPLVGDGMASVPFAGGTDTAGDGVLATEFQSMNGEHGLTAEHG